MGVEEATLNFTVPRLVAFIRSVERAAADYFV